MMDEKGQLIVALPPSRPVTIGQILFFYGIVPLMIPAILAFKCFTNKSFLISFPNTSKSVYSIVNAATICPISREWYFQDPTLLQKLWQKPSARAYLDEATQQPRLEYQMREGFCGSATQRCILRSFGLCPDTLPSQNQRESNPIPWCEHISQIAKEHSASDNELDLSTRILRGDVGYDEFLSSLREGLANDNVRIACNYLRTALTGFEKIRYIPTNMIFAMLAGHFSPILGIIENHDIDGRMVESDNPFVAIFDTNHKYNGTYFVPARRLYKAVKAVDLWNNNHRAIVFVEKTNS